ncbi:uncharacterized protein RAG0_08424 [Rhynchosporium agropyri]|uniref:Uncharacterized protein n=1 Tax=Rhynchosporium agropyri TaxID=914238 RepID=A0A1E1KQU5_9HELO|nr:uncharacterized protein RAG0_08424 [Rhynchosporium agropyri]
MKRFFYLEVYDSLADYHCRRKSTSVEQQPIHESESLKASQFSKWRNALRAVRARDCTQ